MTAPRLASVFQLSKCSIFAAALLASLASTPITAEAETSSLEVETVKAALSQPESNLDFLAAARPEPQSSEIPVPALQLLTFSLKVSTLSSGDLREAELIRLRGIGK